LVHRTQDIVSEYSKMSSSLSNGFEPDSSLMPDFLVDLSNSSMKALSGDRFRPREVSLLEFRVEDYSDTEPALVINSEEAEFQPIRIEAKSGENPIAAIDVSSIKTGETEEGFICAVRGAVVWKDNGSYYYVRCGPLTFHVTAKTNEHLTRALGFQHSAFLSSWPTMFPQILSRIRNVLERWVQRIVCSSFKNATVLFDGSLTAGTPDNPVRYVQAILNLAKERGNTVLAFSKATKLCISGRNITDYVRELQPPCLLDVDSIVSKQFSPNPIRLLGRVHVAKLDVVGFTFRLDIDRQILQENGYQAVGQLVGSDILDHGYPETLRLAHILSTFTANEIIGIQRFISRTYGIQITPKLSLRKSLFGPFGTSREVA